MLTAHRELFISIASKPQRIDEEYSKLTQEMSVRIQSLRFNPYQQPFLLSPVDIELFLFLATDPNLKPDPINSRDQQTYLILQQGTLRTILDPKPSHEPFRKLFVEYLSLEKSPLTLQRAIQLAGAVDLNAALPTILKICKDKNYSGLRSDALLVVSLLGGKEILPELIPFFQDTSPVQTFGALRQKKRSVEIRDVALGIALNLHKQNLTDYGYDQNFERVGSLESRVWQIAFAIAPEARETALKKWNEFAKKEKLLTEPKK